ncbi:class I SAM-dependent methyltransferase [Fodinibius halophilus]|uniref:Methyltransferase domain-containing protein n=1 Tax=Fodinibius halophilus TaxID=1736908 RepID=A0A6M1T1C1_9BACT|nr:methyltransferase domain-containing protein [Fodinibius halophilus]NGP87787.1 methyltransferase domain-containing protein [Fodinibius halophilus]
MSRIAYDPVKDRFADIIRRFRFLRTLFYMILDLFFLRSWYVRAVLRKFGTPLDREGRWTLLDAGSGFGQYDRFILQQFDHVKIKAIDVKADYLEDSQHYFQEDIAAGCIEFQQENLLHINYDRDFNFAICIDVLEHIEEDVKVMTNIQHALKEEGYFLMHSPSIFSEEDADGDDSFVDEHARAGYSKEDIKEKLKTAGFEPLHVAYTYGEKGHMAWKMLIKYPMLWLNRIKLWALPIMAVYYLFTLPVGLSLMWLDLNEPNVKGTGIYALARKRDTPK